MSLFRRLAEELDRRSVWSILAVYLGASWLVLQVVISLVEALALPASLPAVTVVLFLVGLPIVLVTAIIQRSARRRGARLFTWRNTALVGGAALALWGAVATVLMIAAGPPAFRALDDPSRRAVAVLPFTNMADDDDRYFADGVHEDLLTQLAFVGDLAVTSRTGVERFRGTALPVGDIAAQLGVEYIVEGSVRRDGDRVRIVAQLIDAATDTHLWARTYDRHLADVFAIQSEVAAAIAGALSARLAPGELERVAGAPAASPGAYDLYLQARELGRGDREAVERGIEMIRAALDLDPEFAPAWAGLASLYGQRVQVAGLDLAWADSGAAAARRAIDLAPDRPEGHKELALNLILLGRTDDAHAHLRRAIELNPSYADAMQNLGVIEYRAGRHDEAVLWLERARRIAPGHPWVLVALAQVYAELDLWDHVRRVVDTAQPAAPETLLLRAISLHFPLMRGDAVAGLPAARALVARAPFHPWVLAEAVVATHAAGRPDQAREWAERLHEIAPTFRYADSGKTAGLLLAAVLDDLHADPDRVATLLADEERRARADLDRPGAPQGPALTLAEIHARRGDSAAALDFLQMARDRGLRAASLLAADPGLASLRDDPAFGRLLDRMENDLARARARLPAS